MKLREYLVRFVDVIRDEEELKGWVRTWAQPSLIERARALVSESRFFILTPYRICVPSTKHKFVDPRLPGLYTDTELLRYALEDEYKTLTRRSRISYRTKFADANRLYFPYTYSTGLFRGEYVKVDIRACFYSIYSLLGLDCTVVSDIDHVNRVIHVHALGLGALTVYNSSLIHMLSSDKILRNSAYGLTRACFETVYVPGTGYRRQYFRGKTQNLDLHVAIAAILHDIVFTFKQHILYWNVDGGIVSAYIIDSLRAYVEEYCLTLRTELHCSEVHVLGLGSYRCDSYTTLHYDAGVCSREPSRENVYRVCGSEKIRKYMRWSHAKKETYIK